MNIPTIGRRVWYHPLAIERSIDGTQPFDAGICYVYSDTMVNLAVKNEYGYDVPGKTSIRLHQKPEEAQPGEASWMDYHVKTDQAAKAQAHPGPVTMIGGETLGAEPVGN